jgi:hypothetical protein
MHEDEAIDLDIGIDLAFGIILPLLTWKTLIRLPPTLFIDILK